MSIKRTFASAALGVCLALAVVAVPATAQSSTRTTCTSPGRPRRSREPPGWPISSRPRDTSRRPPDLVPTCLRPPMRFWPSPAPAWILRGLRPPSPTWRGNVSTYVSQDGSDGPGELALLILDAHALGASATVLRGDEPGESSAGDRANFGRRCRALRNRDSGRRLPRRRIRPGPRPCRVAGVGITSGAQVSSAETWLHGQQCPDGGWTSYVNVVQSLQRIPGGL